MNDIDQPPQDDIVYWVAKLSNGNIIYQNDYHEKCTSWTQLQYLINNTLNIYIDNIKLKFRSHEVELPSKANGYAISNGIIATMTGTQKFVVVRIQNKDKLTTVWYHNPSLEIFKVHTEQFNRQQLRDNFIINYPYEN